jgi:hypothetical protein
MVQRVNPLTVVGLVSCVLGHSQRPTKSPTNSMTQLYINTRTQAELLAASNWL